MRALNVVPGNFHIDVNFLKGGSQFECCGPRVNGYLENHLYASKALIDPKMNRIALTYPNRYDNAQMNDICMTRIGAISNSLKSRGFDVVQIPRDDLPATLDDYDLVVAAGGDGTQLDAAIRIRTPSTHLCGVRLFPERSVGYLCRMDYEDFDRFASYLRDDTSKLATDRVQRLACEIDGECLDVPIVNDVLVAHACPARASRYRIMFGGRTQLQCSSGIWVATNSGSHAAAHAAGADALDPADDTGCVFVVRELSQYPADDEPIRKSRFSPGLDDLSIESVSSSLHLYSDGALFDYPIKKHQTIRFRPYSVPLHRVFC